MEPPGSSLNTAYYRGHDTPCCAVPRNGDLVEAISSSHSELCSSRDCDSPPFTDCHCLDHTEDAELEAAVNRWRLGKPLDARGLTISSEGLERLLRTLVQATKSQSKPLDPDQSACFPGTVLFDGAHFDGPADFSGVIFNGPASFDHAVFEGYADFRRTEFGDHADFDNAEFQDGVSFRGAIFNDHAGFQRAAILGRSASFISVKFRSYVDFELARFDADVELKEATFQLARTLGPFSVAGHVEFDGCVFDERVAIEVLAEQISATSATFADGVRISVAEGQLRMDRVDFGAVATLSRLPSLVLPPSRGIDAQQLQRLATVPQLTTLQGAQVASLSISGIGLANCRFFGAHGLESIVIEPSCSWRHPPASRRCIDRKMIVEEQEWRERREEDVEDAHPVLGKYVQAGWREGVTDPVCREFDANQRRLEPAQLAALYRALRKASEDNNDQAGAGDLYYGEMEMRRLTAVPDGRGWFRATADRAILVAYWLLAGYGLRAWRSVGALVATLLVASALLWQVGFREAESFRHASRVSVASATSLVRPVDDDELNGAGFGVEIFLRFTGPALLTLSALAIRSRIKR